MPILQESWNCVRSADSRHEAAGVSTITVDVKREWRRRKRGSSELVAMSSMTALDVRAQGVVSGGVDLPR